MDVTIQGTNVKITEDIEAHARKKLDRLDRYLPRIREIQLDLSHEHTKRGEDLVSAQITVRHSRGAILRAEEKTGGDVKKAIDKAVDKMYRRVQRFKGRRIRKGKERFTATLEELSLAEDIPDIEEFVEENGDLSSGDYETQLEGAEEYMVPIARRKDVQLSPMTEVEAIEQMELLGHSFFMFYNADTQVINVLYRRTSGDYGLLVPAIP
ncbi:MAG: ribosome-associated translation inhibitor RaiA [Anaerolineae bacterium]|nr:ribosome-associated translation inhibitor RaiA [Anaerolineae bacterium]